MRSLLIKLQNQILSRTNTPDLSEFRDESSASKNSLSKPERYAIYENAYWIRRIEAIGDEFDHVEEVLGPNDFRELIEAYVRATPSRSWTLSESVSAFSKFIRNTYSANSFSLTDRNSRISSEWNLPAHLASVAEWDALRTEAFRASSTAPGNSESPFAMNPTARSCVLSSNDAEYLRKTFAIESLIQDDSDDPEESNGGNEPLLLVWRNDLAESDYELEERILFGRSAKVWKTIESEPPLKELETRLAELAYDADSARNLFYALSSGGALITFT